MSSGRLVADNRCHICAGNVVKVKQQKKTLNNKEKKKAKKLKEAQRARGEEVSDSEDEY